MYTKKYLKYKKKYKQLKKLIGGQKNYYQLDNENKDFVIKTNRKVEDSNKNEFDYYECLDENKCEYREDITKIDAPIYEIGNYLNYVLDKLLEKDRINILLGAHNEEEHVKNSDQYDLCITEHGKGNIYNTNPYVIYMDFNNDDDLKKLEILNNKVDNIIFDLSVIKFWENKITYFLPLLKPLTGKFYIPTLQSTTRQLVTNKIKESDVRGEIIIHDYIYDNNTIFVNLYEEKFKNDINKYILIKKDIVEKNKDLLFLKTNFLLNYNSKWYTIKTDKDYFQTINKLIINSKYVKYNNEKKVILDENNTLLKFPIYQNKIKFLKKKFKNLIAEKDSKYTNTDIQNLIINDSESNEKFRYQFDVKYFNDVKTYPVENSNYQNMSDDYMVIERNW